MAENKSNKRFNDISTGLGIIAIIFLLNYILSFSFGRFDLTEDQRHSLSPNTIDLLQNAERISDRIFFKVYLDGDLPADLRTLRNSVKEMLDEFIVYAGDNIQYEFIDPAGNEDEQFNLQMQDNLAQQGLEWTELEMSSSSEIGKKIIWPGALVEYKGTTMGTVQFFRGGRLHEMQMRDVVNATISKLEYQLIAAIRKVTGTNKKTVSFLHGHGELRENDTKDVRRDLGEHYLIDEVTINGQLSALDGTDALIIAQPKTRFNEKDKFIIDQYIMNGGRVLWLIDPLTVPRDTLYRTGQTMGMTNPLNIEKDMLFKYGVRINSDLIVDQECGPMFWGQTNEITDWYFYPLMRGDQHMITSNLNPVRGQYTGSMEIVNASDKDVQKTVLLHSSVNSIIYRAPARVSYLITQQPPKLNDGKQGDFPTAVLLEGQFKSSFENRGISETFLSSSDYQTKFKSDSTKMIVVSDGDVIRNDVLDSLWTGQKWIYQFIPLNTDMYGVKQPDGSPKYAYANKDFILNSVDYLLDDYSLIDIRTKTITLRHLNESKVKADRPFWKFLNIAFPLLVIVLLAIGQIVIRRRRYTV